MYKEIHLLSNSAISPSKEGNFLVDRLSHYLDEHRNLIFPHRHRFYHMVLFTKGKGRHTIDFTEFDVKPWQFYCMVPGQVHTWEFEGEIEGFVINFDADFFWSLLMKHDYLEQFSFFSQDAADNVRMVPDVIRGAFCHLLEEVYSEVHQGEGVYWDLIRLNLLKCFILLDRALDKPHSKSDQSYKGLLVQHYRQLIDQHFLEMRLPREYAERLHVTPNHLNVVSKEITGLTAGELIRQRLLLEAKRMLVNQKSSISEIAYKLNFSDHSYFTKFFKKMEGMTPEEFRAMI